MRKATAALGGAAVFVELEFGSLGNKLIPFIIDKAYYYFAFFKSCKSLNSANCTTVKRNFYIFYNTLVRFTRNCFSSIIICYTINADSRTSISTYNYTFVIVLSTTD